MRPLSAVAVIITFVLFGLDVAGWATINGKFMGVVFIIAAVLILIDAFWAYAPALGVRRNPPA
jgi:hypothetical protein